MARWYRSVHPDQVALLPADIRSWLPPDHLAWQILGVTGELDLSGFAAAYRADGQGQAPYDPAMMLGLVLYCYFKGIRSSRKIRDACVDDVGARVICGGARPSHRAVAEFLRRHRAEVRRLFVQVLGLLAAAGAVGGHSAAIDGSPVSGNASRFANLDQEQLDRRIAALEAEIAVQAEAWLAGAGQADGRDGQQPLPDGDGDGEGSGAGGGVPRRLSALAAKLARLRAARDTLAARQAAPGSPDARVAAARQALGQAGQRLAKAEEAQAAVMARYHAALAAGKPWPAGRKPVPAGQNARIARIRKNVQTARDRLAAAEARAAAAAPAKISGTDPGTRMLPAKNGGWLQGWNLELAAARRQILLAIELHDNPADTGALTTMIAAAAASCDQAGLRDQIRAWLADNGYASTANFQALEHLMLLVAVTGEAAQTGRADTGRALPAGWEKMAARLATPAGKKLYKRRAAQVEPAFAQLFARFGRYVSYRGRDAVDAEIKLLGTVHNIAKLLSHRRQHPAAAPA